MILGEVHDSPFHHDNQAAALTAIDPTAVVFEMLSPEQAAAADGEARRSAEALSAALEWETSGWPDFALYWPVFEAVGDRPILGAALPRATVRAAVSEDPAGLFDGDAARFGLDIALPAAEQAEREAEQFTAHCDALPEEMLPGMVAAQRLRDAAFARTVLDALDTYGAPVVLITGNGHARTDWGVPRYLSVAAPDVSVFALGQLEQAPEEKPPFDGFLVTAPTERPDPCEAFRG